jgi:SAM-dependent methyltransferase
VTLFLASLLALYFELVVIRYLSTEIRVFAYLKNLPLIASFLGLGVGMILGKPPKLSKRAFPFIAATLFLLIAYASPLHFTHLVFPGGDYVVWGSIWNIGSPLRLLLLYLSTILGVLGLIIEFFVVLGGIVGQELSLHPPVRAYGLNLGGSLAGILAFATLSFFHLPPVVWVLGGFLLALPLFIDNWLAVATFAVIAYAIPGAQPNTYWSPYYRITLDQLRPPSDWPSPAAYLLNVNHDYHQKAVDLSAAFMARYPEAEPNRSARATYELPYRFVENPADVLVVGAGTGNDVAAALRHGAKHIDAVEIDPVILELGRKYHPERPYDSSRVTSYLDDARAFFKKTRRKYDLIVFGYLDSHTLLTSFSSLRLDNYVYTLESFREARGLLKPGGTLVLAFASGRSFVTDRLFSSLTRAFGVPPLVYDTRYDESGVVFVEGVARPEIIPIEFPEISKQLQLRASASAPATDRWPFLYLRGKTIPFSIASVLILFLAGSLTLIGRRLGVSNLADPESLHFFFLGAGFLLLETKGVTQLALLFGSTWVVNAVVIGAFLAMALLANTVIMLRPISRHTAYVGLFVSLGLDTIFPYTLLGGLPPALKVMAAGSLVGLPVFFSGLVFSESFRDLAQPWRGLGVNLLGAVVGGTLENTVMLAGTPILGALAIVLYGASAVFARKGSLPRPLRLPVCAEGSLA